MNCEAKVSELSTIPKSGKYQNAKWKLILSNSGVMLVQARVFAGNQK
jgi:hypothetical protein